MINGNLYRLQSLFTINKPYFKMLFSFDRAVQVLLLLHSVICHVYIEKKPNIRSYLIFFTLSSSWLSAFFLFSFCHYPSLIYLYFYVTIKFINQKNRSYRQTMHYWMLSFVILILLSKCRMRKK